MLLLACAVDCLARESADAPPLAHVRRVHCDGYVAVAREGGGSTANAAVALNTRLAVANAEAELVGGCTVEVRLEVFNIVGAAPDAPDAPGASSAR